MSAPGDYTSEMLQQANAAFERLQDVADTLTVEELAPVVIELLKDLNLSEEAAETAFQRMVQSSDSAQEAWTDDAERGAFIVFEGLDRAGKSTQSRVLRARLEEELREAEAESAAQEKVHWMCFPYRQSPLGSLIDLYLRRKVEMPDRAIHLLFSANRWEMADAIIEKLNAGRTVVCDRYAFSGVVYSVAKGLDASWCRLPDVGIPRPDLVFFLYLDPEVGATRAAFGDERYENTRMQAAVREEFEIANFGTDVSWHAIDGAQEREAISSQIYDIYTEFVSKPEGDAMPPVERLWS